MKFSRRLLLALGALSLSGCVSDKPTVSTLRPTDPVKRNTFDDLKPKTDADGFADPRASRQNTRP